MKHRNISLVTAGLILFGLVFLTGCSDKPKDYLVTPETTIETYMMKAGSLKRIIDPLAYSRAIDCFAKPAVAWYKANADGLVEDKGELDGYVGSKREAYVFANFVVPFGPEPRMGKPEVEKVSQSKKKATFRVNGMELDLVKEGPNWRIASMFGLEK